MLLSTTPQQQILTTNGQTYVAAPGGTTFMLADGTRAIATSINNSNNNQQLAQIQISGQTQQLLQQRHNKNHLQPQYIVSTQYQQQIAPQQPSQQIVVVAQSPMDPNSLLQQQQQSQQIQLQQMQQPSQLNLLRAPAKAKTPPKFVATASISNSNFPPTHLKNASSNSINKSATKTTPATLSMIFLKFFYQTYLIASNKEYFL